MRTRSKHRNMPMTSGSIPRHLLVYSIPAILGDLFQVTYNTVDSVIVGKYAGADALAAVGVASPLMSIAMFFIIGMGIGASVLMSEYYGAQNMRSLRREFFTTLLIAIGLSAAISILLIIFSDPLLQLVNTPSEIMENTGTYLRIVAAGMLVTGLYNILAAASRSIGDTRTPLACLIAGSLINIGLDFWFVSGLGWGVAGAAWATVISQGCSAALCFFLLYRTEPLFFADRKDFCVDRFMLKKTMKFSYASALQQAGVYIGRLVVQAMVNPLGVQSAAAFTAVNRVDDYALIPERDIAGGETVLVAQNHGAGKTDRMQKGLKISLLMEIIYGIIVSICVFSLAEPLMKLFVPDGETEVVLLGTRYLRIMGLFYFLPGITNGLQGYMRAIGKMNLTMYVTYTQMFVRALGTFLLIRSMKLDAVPFACAMGWLVMMIWEIGLIIHWRRKKKLY